MRAHLAGPHSRRDNMFNSLFTPCSTPHPTLQVMFVSGVAVDRLVGFDQLGASDDFPTSAVCFAPPILLLVAVALTS